MDTDGVIRVVVGAAYEVSNALGAGFREKVYHQALLQELTERGLKTRSEVRYPVSYKGRRVGVYVADLIVEDCVLVELKCVDPFGSEHMAQCLNYLKASALHLALLINFQKSRVEWKRIIL
jgi:GxxExxY protein